MAAARWSCCAITRTSTSRRPSGGFAPGAYCRIPAQRAARRCYLHQGPAKGQKRRKTRPSAAGAGIRAGPGPASTHRSGALLVAGLPVHPDVDGASGAGVLANRRLWRPELPTVAAVQLCTSTPKDNRPWTGPRRPEGGRSAPLGMLQGAAVVLGNPLLPEASAPTHVAEGLADAEQSARRIGEDCAAQHTRQTGAIRLLAGSGRKGRQESNGVVVVGSRYCGTTRIT